MRAILEALRDIWRALVEPAPEPAAVPVPVPVSDR